MAMLGVGIEEREEDMENQITVTYDRDSKRYHRFLIDEGQGITGTIYVPKEKEIPDTITIHFKTKEEKERSE